MRHSLLFSHILLHKPDTYIYICISACTLKSEIASNNTTDLVNHVDLLIMFIHHFLAFVLV